MERPRVEPVETPPNTLGSRVRVVRVMVVWVVRAVRMVRLGVVWVVRVGVVRVFWVVWVVRVW